MTTIRTVRDDQGPTDLKIQNETPETVGQVPASGRIPALGAEPATPPVTARPPRPPTTPVGGQRDRRPRNPERRRQRDRRRNQKKVLLDTRSGRQRRTRMRRDGDLQQGAGDEPLTTRGIDRYV
ncbi:MAG: hypothetical protein HY940_00115 [Gammaproteobacteria bacterium]|nr:hypothetical protein [Gammaproteobacteria bacterium]